MKIFRSDYDRALDRLTTVLVDGDVGLSTLGPEGTSSHHAAEYLRERLIGAGLGSVRIQLRPTFDGVLTDVTGGAAPLALVPSAYRDATAFHWHPKLRLLFHFARPTPTYGLAGRTGRAPDHPVLRIATMSEVSVLYPEMCPPALRDRPVEWVPAASTMDAARLLAGGEADLALTNDNGRDAHDLAWLSRRPGTRIVWLLFTNLSIDEDD